MHKCVNNSIGNVYHLEQLVGDFFPYSQEKLQFDKNVTIIFQSDEENSSRMLGKTAYYDPNALEVTLYVDGRHPKDIMRSLSHELVHHAQNCRGDFDGDDATPEGYAQSNPQLRKMEREAYTKGNLIFRDYEDLIKTGKKQVDIDFTESGEPKMSLKEWKNNEINTKLMKKWGFLKEGKLPAGDAGHGGSGDDHYQFDKKERDAELEEGHEHSAECGCPDMEEGMKYRAEDDDLDENHVDLARDRGQLHKALSPEELGIGSKEHDDEEGNRDPSDDAILGLKEDSEGEETYHYGEAEGHDEKELHDLVRRHATRSHIDALKRDMDYDEDHEDRGERGTHFREGKISVREAKQITRRIIERIRKEGK